MKSSSKIIDSSDSPEPKKVTIKIKRGGIEPKAKQKNGYPYSVANAAITAPLPAPIAKKITENNCKSL